MTDLREMEQLIGSLPALDRWTQTPVQASRPVDVENLLATTLALPRPICPILPSSLSGVFGPATFSAPLSDPEVERVELPALRKVAVYVTFRGECIATKMAELKEESTGEELLEAVWSLVIVAAKNTGDPFHYGAVLLPGKRLRLWLKDPLSLTLRGTEAVLEISFSDKVHTNSVAFQVDVGKVPMSRQNQETGEDPQVPPEFRNMRPTTPDRKKEIGSNTSGPEGEAKTQKEIPMG